MSDFTPSGPGVEYRSSVFTVVDALSKRLDAIVETEAEKIERITKEGMRAFYESNMGRQMASSIGPNGPTVDDLVERADVDAPFSEGRSGLRNFVAMGSRGPIRLQLERLGLLKLARRLADSWFAHGDYSKLDKVTKDVVLAASTFEQRKPFRVYREETVERIRYEPGSTVHFAVPKSWSGYEKALCGNVTFVLDTTHGTHVSALSPYPGEGEVIVYHPNGYVVRKVEERTWAGKFVRRIFYLAED